MTDEKLSAQEEAFLRGEPEAVAALEGPQSEIAPEPEAVKPEPERAVEQAAEPDAADPDDGMVPHGALAQARAKARQYREALAKAEQDRARLEGRLEALMKPSAPAEPEKPLKFSDDPMRVGEDLIKTTSEIRAELAAIKEQTALQHHMAALNQTLLGAEASYKSTTPDYDQAKIHARTSYFEELRAIGYDDETAFNTVVRREQQIVNNRPRSFTTCRRPEVGPAPNPPLQLRHRLRRWPWPRRGRPPTSPWVPPPEALLPS
jgi:hypothetical protein